MSTDDSDQPWLLIRSGLRRAVSDSTWHLWLEPLRVRSVHGSVLTVEAPGATQGWIADRFSRLLHACAATVLGPEAEVCLVDAAPAAKLPRAPVSASDGWRRAEGPARSAQSDSSAAGFIARADRLNPRLTFDQFVIGDSNRLAHAAALAVAEMPGLAYNPVFICGPPGLGKTHLLHSIATYVSANGDGLTVRYTTGEGFTNHFTGALHCGGIDAFKEAYRGVDVLLVDDVQFLQRKVKTEEEFFHTFDELLTSGAQIVLSSDRLPRDMEALEDRLRERFEAGLVCDVKPPDYDTRLTVLRKLVLHDGIADVDEAALELIAARVRQNIRALEGALIRIVAFGSLTRRPFTAELAAEVLSGLYPDLEPRRRTIAEIQGCTCEAFSVSLDELLSHGRSARVARARQVAMYLSRELTDQTLPAIGRAFGGRNHTTVMHACKRTAERMATDPRALVAVERLTTELGHDRPA